MADSDTAPGADATAGACDPVRIVPIRGRAKATALLSDQEAVCLQMVAEARYHECYPVPAFYRMLFYLSYLRSLGHPAERHGEFPHWRIRQLPSLYSLCLPGLLWRLMSPSAATAIVNIASDPGHGTPTATKSKSPTGVPGATEIKLPNIPSRPPLMPAK